MIHFVFAVHDAKAKAYLPPFILPTKEMAKRTFSDCVNDFKHAFGRHPYDYTLFHLGMFDDSRATYALEKAPMTMGNGVEYKVENFDTEPPELELVTGE